MAQCCGINIQRIWFGSGFWCSKFNWQCWRLCWPMCRLCTSANSCLNNNIISQDKRNVESTEKLNGSTPTFSNTVYKKPTTFVSVQTTNINKNLIHFKICRMPRSIQRIRVTYFYFPLLLFSSLHIQNHLRTYYVVSTTT